MAQGFDGQRRAVPLVFLTCSLFSLEGSPHELMGGTLGLPSQEDRAALCRRGRHQYDRHNFCLYLLTFLIRNKLFAQSAMPVD